MGSQWGGGSGSDWDWGDEEGLVKNRGKRWGSREGYRENEWGSRELSLYIDTNDWWVGIYRGPNHWYMCLVPMIVIRWKRFRDEGKGDAPDDAR